MRLAQILNETLTTDVIYKRIFAIRDASSSPVSAKTCWNVVGAHLRDNPDDHGTIYLVGTKKPEYVEHAFFISDSGKAVDIYDGKLNADETVYTHEGSDYDVLSTWKV